MVISHVVSRNYFFLRTNLIFRPTNTESTRKPTCNVDMLDSFSLRKGNDSRATKHSPTHSFRLLTHHLKMQDFLSQTVDVVFCLLCKARGFQLYGLCTRLVTRNSHLYLTALFSSKTEIYLHLKKTRCLKIALKLFKFSVAS